MCHSVCACACVHVCVCVCVCACVWARGPHLVPRSIGIWTRKTPQATWLVKVVQTMLEHKHMHAATSQQQHQLCHRQAFVMF